MKTQHIQYNATNKTKQINLKLQVIKAPYQHFVWFLNETTSNEYNNYEIT